MKNDKSGYKEKCVYTGRRLGSKGNTLYRFEKPNGEEMYFAGVKGVYIGHTYACGESSIASRPERLDVDRIDNPEWDAADALVSVKRAEKRAEAKIKSKASPALKKAIEALKPLLVAKSYFDRKSLIEYLVKEATGK